jgi:hypothetical protein
VSDVTTGPCRSSWITWGSRPKLDTPPRENETAEEEGRRQTKSRTGVSRLPRAASGSKLSYYALLPLLFLRTLRFCFLPGGPPEPPASV